MSSDEEAVGRPGRPAGANGSPSPAPSDARNHSGENHSPAGAGGDQIDEDDDADLFGSEGEDGDSVNLEYKLPWEPQDARRTLIDSPAVTTGP